MILDHRDRRVRTKGHKRELTSSLFVGLAMGQSMTRGNLRRTCRTVRNHWAGTENLLSKDSQLMRRSHGVPSVKKTVWPDIVRTLGSVQLCAACTCPVCTSGTHQTQFRHALREASSDVSLQQNSLTDSRVRVDE